MNYKIIISGNKLYNEISIPKNKDKIQIGSAKDSQIRIPENAVYSKLMVSVTQENEGYVAICESDVHTIDADGKSTKTRKLKPGDRIPFFDDVDDNQLLQMDFLYDFGVVQTDFNYQISVADRAILTIGGYGSDIEIKDEHIKEAHCILTRNGDVFEIDGSGIDYGIYINGAVHRENNAQLKEKQFLKVYGVEFYFENNMLCTDKSKLITTNLPAKEISESNNQFHYPEFVKNVRLRFQQPTEKLEVLQPQQAPQKQPITALLSMLPMFVMMIVMMFLRSSMYGGRGNKFMIMYGLMYGMSMVMSIVMFINGRREYKRKTKERIEKYNEYVRQKDIDIYEERENERVISEKMNILPENMVEQILSFDARLFEKSAEHKDFLDVPIGRGVVDAINQVQYRKSEFYETEDPLMNYPKELSEKYEKIADMPIVLHLNSINALGIIGLRDRLCAMARNIILTIAGQHYYDDVKFYFLMSNDDVNDFYWIKWLKNITDAGRRNIMYDQDSKKVILDAIYNELSAREGEKEFKADKSVHYIVFAYRTKELMEHPITKYVNNAKNLGFTFIFFDEYKELIHEDCDEVIYLDRDMNKGFLQRAEDAEKMQGFEYQEITKEQAKAAAIKLACVHVSEISLESTLTKNISFFQMYDVLNAYDLNVGIRWNNSQIFESMAVPIGVDSAGNLVKLDIHEKGHGPHGLVAGTTGAGKSELLQTYVLSMCTQFHPYEVGFIIIDFKGGGMANQFKDLPHLNGAITNIDGKQVNRSLMSIKAELMKRQRLFAQAGVNAIDSYIDLYKKGQVSEPLPHLILIVDEFAELKSDQPEFMKELISAARIGRSLGVHLILATQKPSGVVNDQIWSNSRFKLCLKVQDKADSNEVLKSPLAAEIREPGRCYMEVGNHEIFQLLQSAYSGAPSGVGSVDKTSKFEISQVNLHGTRQVLFHQEPKKEESTMTQLEAVVGYISDFCEKHHIEKLPPICLPPLEEVIPLPDTANAKYDNKGICVPIGIYDDPENQVQDYVWLNLTESNTFIIGSSLTGKTNLMQSIIRSVTERYGVDEVSLYILDFASMILKNFSSLAYVGGVVTIKDENMLLQFLGMIESIIDERQKAFAEMGLSSFAAYREAGYKEFKQVVIIMENYSAFRSTYDEMEETFLNFCRDGLAVGVSVIVTNPTVTGVGFKILTNFGKKISFYSNDSSQYGGLFDRCRTEPDDVTGRAIINMDGGIREFQTFLAFDAKREIDRIELIRKYVSETNEKCGKSHARRIPTIPDMVDEAYINDHYGSQKENIANYNIPAGISYTSIEPVYLPLMRNTQISIHGQNELGRDSFIKFVLATMENYKDIAPTKVYIVDDVTRELEAAKGLGVVEKYTINAGDIVEIIKEVCDEVGSRYDEMAANPEIMNEKPFLVILINTPIATDIISKNQQAQMMYDIITTKLRGCRACIMHSNAENVPVSYKTPDIIKNLATNATHLIFEDVKQIRNVEIPLAFARANSKRLEYGDAYYIDNGIICKVKTVMS